MGTFIITKIKKIQIEKLMDRKIILKLKNQKNKK